LGADNLQKMMQIFEFDYDSEHDALFIYSKTKKSKGAVSFGNFIFDFDDEKNLVAIEIMNAREVLSDAMSKELDLKAIDKINVSDFKKTGVIKIDIKTKYEKSLNPIIIPNFKLGNHVLN
jgi:uncharacterized protein YuzE